MAGAVKLVMSANKLSRSLPTLHEDCRLIGAESYNAVDPLPVTLNNLAYRRT